MSAFFWMTISGSTAFAISESGAYSLDPGSSKLNRIGSSGITINPSPTDPTRAFLGTMAGLESIRNANGQWLSEGLLTELPYAIEGMADNGTGDLFLSVEKEGFYRIQMKKGAQPYSVTLGWSDCWIPRTTRCHPARESSATGKDECYSLVMTKSGS